MDEIDGTLWIAARDGDLEGVKAALVKGANIYFKYCNS